MSKIELKSIHKEFSATTIIPSLDLTINNQEFMVFVGPSGCGKSTLLRLIAGLETVSSGEIWIDDECVNTKAASERGVAMVFQSYALYPHMTVAKNMGFGLRMSGMKASEVKKQVEEVAETLKLTALLDRYPKALSGGQRQRVAIGRAIVRRPKVFLFDEPLSNLDANLRVQMRIEIARLHEELKTTMIYVTHDQTEAMTLGNRISVINKGVIEQVGAPLELYQNPDNQFVAEFLGAPKINALPYVWDDQQRAAIIGNEQLSPTALGVSETVLQKGAILAIRPEHLMICDVDATNAIQVSVEFVETLGDSCVVYAKLKQSDFKIAMRTNPLGNFHVGKDYSIAVQPNTVLVFDSNNQRIQ